jgi:hypothetical protein
MINAVGIADERIGDAAQIEFDSNLFIPVSLSQFDAERFNKASPRYQFAHK